MTSDAIYLRNAKFTFLTNLPVMPNILSDYMIPILILIVFKYTCFLFMPIIWRH
jgi:hypothetical protein